MPATEAGRFPAARAGLSSAHPTVDHEGRRLVGVTSPSSSGTVTRTSAATLVHWKSTAIGSPIGCRWMACPVRVMACSRGALALRRLAPGRSVSSAPMALPHRGVAPVRPPPPSAGVRRPAGWSAACRRIRPCGRPLACDGRCRSAIAFPHSPPPLVIVRAARGHAATSPLRRCRRIRPWAPCVTPEDPCR